MAQELSEATRELVRSRIPDYWTLTPDDQATQAIKVIAHDFDIYCERNLMIKDKITRQVIPFKLNWAQKLLVERVLADIRAGRPVRYIILKARQMGLSTVIEALCYWWTTTHRYVNSVIIAHETEASSNLYKMFRRYYDFSNTMFKPDRKYNTKRDLVFDVEDQVKEEYAEMGQTPPGLQSEIKTMVAKEGKGRSDTINFFHGSEVAFWEANADVVSSALQAVPTAAETFAFLESTANGVGGYFYDEWQLAKKGESAFKPLFFAWHEHPEYELPGIVSNYDEEELELIEIFREKDYSLESWDRKILWRREKKKEFRTDPKKFYQEYPKDDMEAFLASGRPVFDTRLLMKMEQIALKQPDPMFGLVVANPDPTAKEKFLFEEHKRTFQDQDPTPFKVWQLPIRDDPNTHQKAHKYTIAIDVSEGKLESSSENKENDWSVIDVMDVSNLKTVARWRGHIDPDLLGEVAFAIGNFYNGALIAVEVNNHGISTVQSLRNKFYRNLYQRETSEDEQFQVRTTKMGWVTNKKTKPVIINEMVKDIREGDIIDLDVIFIRECMTYVRDDQGYTSAQEGTFDDCVMAKAINLQMAQWSSYDTEYAKEAIHKPVKRNKYATSRTSTDDLATIRTGTKRPRTNTESVTRRREARAAHRRGRVT
jgi:hypothetical protein